MRLEEMFASGRNILMEGALGERLKREYGLASDASVALAAMVYSEAGRHALRELWLGYMDIAAAAKLPFIATTPTRRANRDRVAASRYGEEILADNLAFLRSVQQGRAQEVCCGGLMGCRGDAYTGEGALDAKAAHAFHAWQAERLSRAGADFLYAGIMPTLPEALGMVRAMEDTGLPYLISFTVRRDGRLIDGTPILRAVETIDEAVNRPPVCYMANCVHPAIVRRALLQPCNAGELLRRRFQDVQGNTSPLPFDQLDGALELKSAPPEEFARDMLRLREVCGMRIFGGCCGTDDRHMRAVAQLLAAHA